MTWDMEMPLRIALVGLALFAGCDKEFCKRRMEIVPGLTWEYYVPLLEDFRPRYSKIVSNRYGVLLEGEVEQIHMTVYTYGFSITCRESCIYVDLLRNVLEDSDAIKMTLTAKKSFVSFDVTTAMGMYVKETHNDFRAAMEALKKRVEAKLKQDGLRRL